MKIRIYYEDTDCGDVVYYANYLKYMERSRTELLRGKGVDLASYHKEGVLFAVVEAKIKYQYPARYNDLLDVRSEVTKLSPSSVVFETDIKNQDKRDIIKGSVKLACLKNGKLTRIPDSVLEKIRV
ncbi:MAG: YbgC/FadM family acyl-CoA thioesterase [Chitinivibrionales bacterium]